MSNQQSRALVLFSGGQDSTTCIGWAMERYGHVETIGFDYGQRHAIELDARQRILARIRNEFPQWGQKLGPDYVFDLKILSQIGGSALTDDVAIGRRDDGLPTSFVPGRNLLFVTAAAALASRRGIRDLIGGMCETDYSGYPDCRADSIAALQQAIRLGMAEPFVIYTPLMKLDKAQTWNLAEQLGGQKFVRLIVEDTVTCYLGDHSRHDWGRGCGECPACLLRASGYRRYAGGEA